ncbi:hypothetical protein [Sorangium cellulosum]|nr:hypothetical protein [Sorangium cellulosum]
MRNLDRLDSLWRVARGVASAEAALAQDDGSGKMLSVYSIDLSR